MSNALLFHFYSGHLFFSSAVVFVVLSVLDGVGVFDQRPLMRRGAGFTAVLCIALAVLGGPPLPLVLALPVLAMISLQAFLGFGGKRSLRLPIAISAILASLIAVGLELPFHLRRGELKKPAALVAIGDSLSSGGFGEEAPWPSVMAGIVGVPVRNLALPSETATMAVQNQLPQLSARSPSRQCVVILIGGNDMLERVSPSEFRAAMDRILSTASDGGRRCVLLVELPLLPASWAYGRVQRSLASKHAGTLVPKRILARVLLAEGNTEDGLHLTQQGHDALARALTEWVGWVR